MQGQWRMVRWHQKEECENREWSVHTTRKAPCKYGSRLLPEEAPEKLISNQHIMSSSYVCVLSEDAKEL